MNKKEVSEIKKVFKDDSGLFTLNKVMTAFVDAEKEIPYKEIKTYYTLPEDEADIMLKTLKKVLSGSVGKGLLEFDFPNTEYEEGGSQSLLYKVLKDEFRTEETVYELLDRIAEGYDYESTYAVFCGFCTYSVLKKDKNHDSLDDSEELYKFIICGICPVKVRVDGLIYSDEQQEIIKKPTSDRIVAQTPQDGFLFPVFNSRATDINSVMYYTHSPKNPNESVVTNVLGCEFSRSSQDEKEIFQRILEVVAGDELNLDVIRSVNDEIIDIVNQSDEDEEPAQINDKQLQTILSRSGVSDERLEELPRIYENSVGNDKFNAENLIDKKTVMNVGTITISVGEGSQDKVSTQVIDGRKCLVIEIDDDLKINGLSANVTDLNSSEPVY